MLVKMRIPHKIKLSSVIQVPYSSTFFKITAVHVRITFASKVFFKIERSKTWVRIRFDGALDSLKYGILCSFLLHNPASVPALVHCIDM